MKLRLPGVALAIVAIAPLLGCTTTRAPNGDSTPVASSSSPVASSSVPVASIIANPIRTDADRVLDGERKPEQFLPFTGVASGMRVLDVSTGAGYTSQLLALAVLPGGMLYAQTPRPGAAVTKRLAEHPQADFVLVERPFDNPIPPGAPKLDLVTLVLNYHDITYLPVDRAKMNTAIFDALKPGGHYVIVDHSSRAGRGISEAKTLHRIDESVVKNEVEQAGFVLEAEGDFLRNPADARDTPSSRPAVPTDKFALRFVKPQRPN